MKNFKSIASLFIVGVRDFRLTPELRSFLKEYPVSGLALFNSPYDTPDNVWKDPEAALEAVHEFSVETFSSVGFLAADQEGGRVRRLRTPFVQLPTSEQVGKFHRRPDSRPEIEKLYRSAAKQMALSGINLNFAPVCDLRYPDSHQVVGDRSFGETPGEVLPLVRMFCETFEKEGVHTTLKHFPGHGPTRFDSHERIAEIFKSKEDLKRIDTSIFYQAASWASAVMTAHIGFEEEPGAIFSLDEKLLNEFKKGLKQGLALITDDLLTMKAVNERKPWVTAVDLGYDFICVCDTLDGASRALDDCIRALESKTMPFSEEEALQKRIDRSSRLFKREKKPAPFSEWKDQILNLSREGAECLEKLERAGA